MRDNKKIAKIVAALLLAAFSFFGAARLYTASASYAETNRYLDEKRISVLELAGVTAATSVAVSILPDDVGTSIADELADLSGYFLLIVSAILLEKYLYGIAGAAAFRFLIPIACALYVLSVLSADRNFQKAAKKLTAFALALFVIVPLSVKLSCVIEERYGCSAQETVASVSRDAAGITEEDNDGEKDENGKASGENAPWWSELTESLRETAGKLTDGVGEAVSSIKEKLNITLSKLLDAIAVLLITACVIPVAVLFVLLWLVKLLFGLDGGAKNFFGKAHRNEVGEAERAAQEEKPVSL